MSFRVHAGIPHPSPRTIYFSVPSRATKTKTSNELATSALRNTKRQPIENPRNINMVASLSWKAASWMLLAMNSFIAITPLRLYNPSTRNTTMLHKKIFYTMAAR
jgi:hypothetical protein